MQSTKHLLNYAGNKCAVFPLQLLGFDVDAVRLSYAPCGMSQTRPLSALLAPYNVSSCNLLLSLSLTSLPDRTWGVLAPLQVNW